MRSRSAAGRPASSADQNQRVSALATSRPPRAWRIASSTSRPRTTPPPAERPHGRALLRHVHALHLTRGPFRSPRLGPEAWSNHPGSREEPPCRANSSSASTTIEAASGAVVLRPSLTGTGMAIPRCDHHWKSGWRRTRSIGSSTPTRPSRRRGSIRPPLVSGGTMSSNGAAPAARRPAPGNPGPRSGEGDRGLPHGHLHSVHAGRRLQRARSEEPGPFDTVPLPALVDFGWKHTK